MTSKQNPLFRLPFPPCPLSSRWADLPYLPYKSTTIVSIHQKVKITNLAIFGMKMTILFRMILKIDSRGRPKLLDGTKSFLDAWQRCKKPFVVVTIPAQAVFKMTSLPLYNFSSKNRKIEISKISYILTANKNQIFNYFRKNRNTNAHVWCMNVLNLCNYMQVDK